MKKIYISPSMIVTKLDHVNVICTSGQVSVSEIEASSTEEVYVKEDLGGLGNNDLWSNLW